MDIESQLALRSSAIRNFGTRAGLGASGLAVLRAASNPAVIDYFRSKKRGREESSSKKDSQKKQKKEESMARTGKAGARNPRFTKSGTKKHRKSKRSRKVSVSKRQVKTWNKAAALAKVDIATMHDFVRNVGLVSAGTNGSSFTVMRGWDVAELETALSNAIYKQNSGSSSTRNDSNPINAALHQEKIPVTVGSNCTWVNNYSVPVWIDVYCMVPKTDHDKSVSTCFTEGLTDQNNPSPTSVHVYPSWSKQLNQMWETTSHKRLCLQTGESISLGFKKKFTFNPATADAQSGQPNRASVGAHTYCARLQGTLGHAHDTPFLAGTSNVEVDFVADFHVKWQYDGGARMTNYNVADVSNAQTGGTVVGCVTNAANTVFTKIVPT